jgi:uncharacterized protein (DUF2141 family)
MGARSTNGSVICRIFSGPDGFPGKATYLAQSSGPPGKSTATCTFPGVAPGTYAVALFHDENGNGKLDTNVLGIPIEGVGVSNNKRPVLGPPKWDDAKFEVAGDTTLAINLRY